MIFCTFMTLSINDVLAETINRYVVDTAGNTYTGTNERLFDAIGQVVIGQMWGSGHSIRSGFFKQFLAEQPTPTVTPTQSNPATLTATPTVIRQFGGEILAHEYVKAAPNPIRGNEGKIYFDLAMPAEIELKIFTPHNQLVLSRHWDQLPAGKNMWTWQIGDLANGVYLLRLQARNAQGKTTAVLRKLIVIK